MENVEGNLLDDIVAYATNPAPVKKPQALILRTLDRTEVQSLKNATSLTLKKYSYTIDPDGMRHLYKKHGLNATVDEIPLTNADLYLIPDVINAPDSIERSDNTTGRGHMAVIYRKIIGEEMYTYIAEVVFKDRVIQTKTMYKNRLP